MSEQAVTIAAVEAMDLVNALIQCEIAEGGHTPEVNLELAQLKLELNRVFDQKRRS